MWHLLELPYFFFSLFLSFIICTFVIRLKKPLKRLISCKIKCREVQQRKPQKQNSWPFLNTMICVHWSWNSSSWPWAHYSSGHWACSRMEPSPALEKSRPSCRKSQQCKIGASSNYTPVLILCYYTWPWPKGSSGVLGYGWGSMPPSSCEYPFPSSPYFSSLSGKCISDRT